MFLLPLFFLFYGMFSPNSHAISMCDDNLILNPAYSTNNKTNFLYGSQMMEAVNFNTSHF